MAAEITTRSRRIGFLQQSNFATPSAASAAFETLNYNSGSVIPDPAIQLANFDVTSTSGLMPKQSRAYIDALSGLPSIPFAAPATQKALAVHFTAGMQVVHQVASTPFQKVITHICDSSIPDFSTGGYLHTIATDAISGTDGWLLESALLDIFTYTIEPNAQGIARLAHISGVWKGNNLQLNQNLSGAWIAESLADFYNNTTKVSLNSSGIISLTDYCWKRYSITINNNIISDCKVAGGKANNYKLSPQITVNVLLPYDSTTYALLNTYKAGTTGSITLTTGTAGTAGFLEIISYGRISAQPVGIDGNYHSINLTMQCEVNTSAGYSAQVTIADAQNRTYPV